MAIPQLTADGYLPAGVHDCSLAEVREQFGKYQNGNQRCHLMDRLETFVQEARAAGFIATVVIDGSFTTSKDMPNDIDLIVVVRMGHDFAAELRPFEYNVVSRRQVRRRFGFDVLVAEQARPEFNEYVDFFAQIRGDPLGRKGMLQVIL